MGSPEKLHLGEDHPEGPTRLLVKEQRMKVVETVGDNLM